MALSLKKTSVSYINGHASKWFPVSQPITFEIQRKDSNVMNKYRIVNEVHFKVDNLPSSVVSGQTVIYNNVNGYYPVVVKYAGNGYIIVDYDIILLQSNLGFFIFQDAYKSYYIETKVLYVNDSDSYETVGVVRNKTDLNGVARVSVQKLLETKTINQNNFAYNTINKKMSNEGAPFNIIFREVYNGVAQPYSSPQTSSALYYSNSALQIQSKYGYNMGEYVPTLDNSRLEKSKFLSVFKKPTYFNGFPFSLSFIYSDNLLNYNINRVDNIKDINNIIINPSPNSTPLKVSERFRVNRMMIDASRINSNVYSMDVWLETAGISTNNTTSGVTTGGGLTGTGLFTPTVGAIGIKGAIGGNGSIGER